MASNASSTAPTTIRSSSTVSSSIKKNWQSFVTTAPDYSFMAVLVGLVIGPSVLAILTLTLAEVLKYSMPALSATLEMAVLTIIYFYFLLTIRVFQLNPDQQINMSTTASSIKKGLQSLLMEVVNCSAVAVLVVLVIEAFYFFTSVIYNMESNSTTHRCVTALLLAAVVMAVLTIIFFNFLLIGQVFRRNNTSTTASSIKKEVQSLHMEVVKCSAVAVQAAMAMTAFYFITFVFIYYMRSSSVPMVIDSGAGVSVVPLDFRLTNERPTPNGLSGRSASNHGFLFGLFIAWCLLMIKPYLGWNIFGFNVLNNTTNTTGRDVVGTATVNEGPKALVDRAKTLRFVLHNFKGMKQKRGEWVKIPLLEAFGYLWGLDVYPKGHKNSDTETECISVFLTYMGDKKYTPSAEFTFRCKKKEHCIDKYTPFAWFFRRHWEHERRVATHLCRKNRMHGEYHYLRHKDVLKYFVKDDGSLIIEVDIRITVDCKLVWYPKQISTETSLKQLFVDAGAAAATNPTEEALENDTTDIVFIVDKVEFPVHKSVLRLHAKTLYVFYKERTNGYDDDDDDDDDTRARVHIFDVNNNTFKQVVEYIYTVNTTPTLVDAAAAIELLLAAHRFECLSLQLYVESVLVDKFVTSANAASMFVLGDSHACALLKEAALNMYVADPTSFRESDTTTPATAAATTAWSKIQESNRLLEELLVYSSNKWDATRNPTTTTTTTAGAKSTDGTNATAATMDVGTLREHLEDANLALDGSREVLVHRLREEYERQ